MDYLFLGGNIDLFGCTCYGEGILLCDKYCEIQCIKNCDIVVCPLFYLPCPPKAIISSPPKRS